MASLEVSLRSRRKLHARSEIRGRPISASGRWGTRLHPTANSSSGFRRVGSGSLVICPLAPGCRCLLFLCLIPVRDPEGYYADMKRNLNSEGLEALMQAAQAGDMRAYERLLREITPKLRQMVRKAAAIFDRGGNRGPGSGDPSCSPRGTRDLRPKTPISCHGCLQSPITGLSTVQGGIIGASQMRSRWTNSP